MRRHARVRVLLFFFRVRFFFLAGRRESVLASVPAGANCCSARAAVKCQQFMVVWVWDANIYLVEQCTKLIHMHAAQQNSVRIEWMHTNSRPRMCVCVCVPTNFRVVWRPRTWHRDDHHRCQANDDDVCHIILRLGWNSQKSGGRSAEPLVRQHKKKRALRLSLIKFWIIIQVNKKRCAAT